MDTAQVMYVDLRRVHEEIRGIEALVTVHVRYGSASSINIVGE